LIPPVVLTHRWGFNEPANSTQFIDSVLGVTNGIIHGGARIDGNGSSDFRRFGFVYKTRLPANS